MQKKISYFFLKITRRHINGSLKIKFLLKFCVKIRFCKHYFRPLNTLTRKEKDPDPDPGGPNMRFGHAFLFYCVIFISEMKVTNGFVSLNSVEWNYLIHFFRVVAVYSFKHYPVFGSAWTEWGHLANPQLAWHSYRQEPVAIRAVTLHSSNSNAGMKQYECGSTQPLLWSKQWSTGN